MTARLQKSPVGRMESLRSWSSHSFRGQEVSWCGPGIRLGLWCGFAFRHGLRTTKVWTRIWTHTPTRTSSRTPIRTRIHIQTRIRTSSATRTTIRTPATTTAGLRIGPDCESRSADPSPGLTFVESVSTWRSAVPLRAMR